MQRTAGVATDTAEDLALGAILALNEIWTTAHRDHALQADAWGEGPSLVSLRDLGLLGDDRAAGSPHGRVVECLRALIERLLCRRPREG